MKRKPKHKAAYYVPRVMKYEMAYIRNRWYVVGKSRLRRLMKQLFG